MLPLLCATRLWICYWNPGRLDEGDVQESSVEFCKVGDLFSTANVEYTLFAILKVLSLLFPWGTLLKSSISYKSFSVRIMENGLILVGERQGYDFNCLALCLQLVFSLYDVLIVAQPSESRVCLVLHMWQVPGPAPGNADIPYIAEWINLGCKITIWE